MNKLGNAQDRAMALIGELGDGLRKAALPRRDAPLCRGERRGEEKAEK